MTSGTPSGCILRSGGIGCKGRLVFKSGLAHLEGHIWGGGKSGVGKSGLLSSKASRTDPMAPEFSGADPLVRGQGPPLRRGRCQLRCKRGRNALGQHITAQGGGGQRRKPRVQCGEDGFAGGGHRHRPCGFHGDRCGIEGANPRPVFMGTGCQGAILHVHKMARRGADTGGGLIPAPFRLGPILGRISRAGADLWAGGRPRRKPGLVSVPKARAPCPAFFDTKGARA